jgi:hypothetical protein
LSSCGWHVHSVLNHSFKENVQLRVTSGSVIVPKAELVGAVLGVNRFGWFQAFRTSARKSMGAFSAMRKCLMSEKSQRACPSARTPQEA